MKALDFVRTSRGNVAMVTETTNEGTRASVTFIGGCDERNAWWDADELEVIDSLPRLLSFGLSHPFGTGRRDLQGVFPPQQGN